MPTCFEELVTIQADGGPIIGRMAYPEHGRPISAALIAGSHPLLGGDMSNNVTTALRLGLAESGIAALSFDYRVLDQHGDDGAEWSQLLSEFWKTSHVALEAEWCRDAGVALDYLKRDLPGDVVLIGYSFGCRVVAELSAGNAAAGIVCISPNPVNHDLNKLRSQSAPLLVISSDNDFSCPPAKLREWFDSLNGPAEIDVFADAEHFFRGRENEVVQAVIRFMNAGGLIGD